jgi:hypothetical protein
MHRWTGFLGFHAGPERKSAQMVVYIDLSFAVTGTRSRAADWIVGHKSPLHTLTNHLRRYMPYATA